MYIFYMYIHYNYVDNLCPNDYRCIHSELHLEVMVTINKYVRLRQPPRIMRFHMYHNLQMCLGAGGPMYILLLIT